MPKVSYRRSVILIDKRRVRGVFWTATRFSLSSPAWRGRRFNGRSNQPELVATIRRAFEAAGVRFLDAGSDSGGVVPPALRAASAKR